jgi:hypothetical protein
MKPQTIVVVGAVFRRRCARHVEAVVGDLHRPALVGDLREPVEVDLAAHARRARDDVRVAVREHDDVAGAELHRRPVRDGGPARAGGDDVVLHHVLDAAQQERRDLRAGGASATQPLLPLTEKKTAPRRRTLRRTSESVSWSIQCDPVFRSSRQDARSRPRARALQRRTEEQVATTPGRAREGTAPKNEFTGRPSQRRASSSLTARSIP